MENVRVANSLPSALKLLSSDDLKSSISNVFVIGGGQIYKEAWNLPQCEKIYITNVLKDFECDTFLPSIDAKKFDLTEVGEIQQENDVFFQFNVHTRKSAADTAMAESSVAAPTESKNTHEEYQYLNLIKDVIENGNVKGDRTGTGTHSKFGDQMRFSLRDGYFPLLTTKRVFWKGVVEELLWLIRGCTSSKELSRKKVKIWDGNGSREFLDKYGHGHREEGDLGPVYGHQWRHFGAPYFDCHTDYTGKGVDQLMEIIHTIKTNPNDRRIIMSAWNPVDLKSMALPPCHVLAQFYVCNGELSCMMYQRSCDLGLGVPFNIASYSLLTCMIAQVCGLKPGEFIHTLGDAHVYNNHIEPLKEQLVREPRPFPKLEINKEKMDIEDFCFEDFKLVDYKPHGTIKMEMAV